MTAWSPPTAWSRPRATSWRRSGRGRRSRLILRGLSAAGAGLGLGCLLAAAPAARLAGAPDGPRALWALRLFGVRELGLAYGLGLAASRPDRAVVRLACDLVILSQAGDLLATAAMALRGSASRRLLLGTWLAAPPTIVAALEARGG